MLLILKEIWDYNKAEMLCVNLAVNLKESGVDVTIFCDSVTGNNSTNRLQSNAIRLYDNEHKGVDNMPKEYDAIVALDNWAIENIPKKINGKIKMRIRNGEDVEMSVLHIIDKIKGKIIEKEIAPKVDKPKTKAKIKKKK